MRTENELRLAVQTGAFFLDRTEHDWVDRIRLDQLALHSSCDCLLGQLHGNFWKVCENWKGVNTYKDNYYIMCHLGFTGIEEEELSTLGKFWEEEITKRRKQP